MPPSFLSHSVFPLYSINRIPGSCHPQWTTTIPLTYELGSDCYFRVRLFRVCPNDSDHTENLGSGIFEVGGILGSKNRTKVRRLPNGGVILCRLEQNDSINQDLTFRFRFAAQLDRERSQMIPLPRLPAAPDTIVEISKQHPSSSGWVPIYRSRPVESSWVPEWEEGQLDLDLVCFSDRKYQSLRIAVLQYRKQAYNQVLGECETTLRMILNTQQDPHSTCTIEVARAMGFPLYDPTSPQKVVGRLQVLSAEKRFSERPRQDLHKTQDAPKLVVQQCSTCSRQITSAFRHHCPTCTDFDQCQECVENPRIPPHFHQLKRIPIPGQQTDFQRSVQLKMELLLHAATCTSPKCSFANCSKMKELLEHAEQCQQQATGGCDVCKRIWELFQIHSRQCRATSCPVPNCRAMRERLRELKMQQAMDDRRLQDMNRVHRAVAR